MARGMGSIYGRKGSPFYWIQFRSNGRTIRESTKKTTRKEAGEVLRARIAELQAGTFVASGERARLSSMFKAVLVDYEVNGRKSGADMALRFRHLLRFFGDCPAEDVTPARMKSFVEARLKAGAARATVHYDMRALRRAFRLAHQDGRIRLLPHFPMPQMGEARRGFFTDAEIARLLKHLPEHCKRAVEFAYITGWRRSEVLCMRWDWVDFEEGCINLPTSKNGEPRTLPFGAHPRLKALMREQRAFISEWELKSGARCAYVFQWKGRQIQRIRKAWAAACFSAGLKGRLFHDLRRSAVRNFERGGVPRTWAMAITGHKDERVYAQYGVVSVNEIAEGLARLARKANR